jgi:hypothetical protein
MPAGRRPLGVTALSLFFSAGTIPATLTAVALAWPGAWSEAMWRLKPEAPGQFARLGVLAIPLMVVVGAACVAAAVGLWTRRTWGHRTAIGLLAVNLLGDTLNAVIRGDWRTLIGLPIGGVMLAYLLSHPVRQWFATSNAAVMSADGPPAPPLPRSPAPGAAPSARTSSTRPGSPPS